MISTKNTNNHGHTQLYVDVSEEQIVYLIAQFLGVHSRTAVRTHRSVLFIGRFAARAAAAGARVVQNAVHVSAGKHGARRVGRRRSVVTVAAVLAVPPQTGVDLVRRRVALVAIAGHFERAVGTNCRQVTAVATGRGDDLVIVATTVGQIAVGGRRG